MWGGASVELSWLTFPCRRLLVPGSAGLLDSEPAASAEDPDGPKLFTPVCRDLPFPGMCTAGMLLRWMSSLKAQGGEHLEHPCGLLA